MKNIKRIILIIVLMFFNTCYVLADTFYLSGLEFGKDGFGPIGQTCTQFLGPTVVKIIHGSVGILRVAAVIIAIASAMFALVPAVISKDADALKKASSKCVSMGIALAAIGIIPSILNVITSLFGFDTTCIF